MKYYKDKANEEESKKTRDKRVNELTKERDKNRDKALRLDRLCTDLKKTVEK